MKIKVDNVRLAFPDIFEPNKDGKYAGAFIFPEDHPCIAAIKAACEEVGKAKWGDKWPAIRKSLIAGDTMPIHNGDIKAEWDGYEGNFFFNASNKARPLVIDRDKSPLAAADGKPYSGCYVNVAIELWAQDNTFGKRINAQLNIVQFARDGDAFGAGKAPSADDLADFDEITDGAMAEDLV